MTNTATITVDDFVHLSRTLSGAGGRVTAFGGENSESGAARFEKDVLSHNPDVVCIDYALNDRGLGVERSRRALVSMITRAT